ncbi:unnamed protein product [marine sediment metagenome]|uniref:Uncharacterized protein n=1 Tax=marine sediment metagenome TaxID=412755 RepID=X1RH32_9ZZZZ
MKGDEMKKKRLPRVKTVDDLAQVEKNEKDYEGAIIPIDPELAQAIINKLEQR